MAAAAGVIVAAVLLFRAVLVARARLWEHMPMPLFAPIPPLFWETFGYLAQYSYLGLMARLGPLSIGVLTALAVSDVGVRQRIRRLAVSADTSYPKSIQLLERQHIYEKSV